jgi:hypothetical protein
MEIEKKPSKRQKVKAICTNYSEEETKSEDLNLSPSHVFNTLNSENPTLENLIMEADITSPMRIVDKEEAKAEVTP